MRILSLLPAATEIIYLLGLEKYLVGVSHECDYPPEVKKKPKVTSSEISNELSSREIDNRVKKVGHRGPGVFHIKSGILEKLRPNLILTQELCEVCAIGFTEVKKAARVLDGDIKIISLEPESVEDILENIRVVGEVGGRKKEAEVLIKSLKSRLDNVKKCHSGKRSASRIGSGQARVTVLPKVLVIEWLDPLMVAGHWVPEMVKLAGGINLITKAKEKSKRITINQIKTSNPDVLIISPCGFDIQRTIQEKFIIDNLQCTIKKAKIFLMDGNAYMTRPGPRIIDGIEILAEILHPK